MKLVEALSTGVKSIDTEQKPSKKSSIRLISIQCSAVACFLLVSCPVFGAIKTVPVQPVDHVVVKTALGNDFFKFKGLEGSEEVGQLSYHDVSLTSLASSVDPDSILGQAVTLEIHFENGGFRFINGIVGAFAQTGPEGKAEFGYRMQVVPRLWLLTQRHGSRIFQEKSTDEIVKQVLRENGISDFQDHLTGNHPERDYTVQYRETDFNFITRLMEESGIFYYFTHGDGSHSLIITDDQSSLGSVGPIPFVDVSSNNPSQPVEAVTDWKIEYRIVPGIFVHDDFNFMIPGFDLTTQSSIIEGHAHADLEFYDYPGNYQSASRGDELAEIRIQEIHSSYAIATAASTASSIASGVKFELTDAAAFDGEYMIVKAEHKFGDGGYSTTFECIPDSSIFRPARRTPVPVIAGPQTAVVVGPAGAEIYTDNLGRVKVQFHWDREGAYDEHSSAWIRLAQTYSGFAVPKIGNEVIVDFEEGNPDRPIVIGRVYNTDDYPP